LAGWWGRREAGGLGLHAMRSAASAIQILAYSLTCRYIYININININAESNGLNYGAAVPDKTGENKHTSVATMNNTINNRGPSDPGIEKGV